MPGKLLKDVSASTIQVLLNQVLGLAIFYTISRWLSKEVFGELNWSQAAAALLITVIAAGTDMIVARRIARANDIRETAGLHFIHALYTGAALALLFVAFYFFLPSIYQSHILLPGILLSQAISFASSPFKQIANGTRAFGHLAILSTISNIVKTILLVICIILNQLTAQNLILLFITGSLIELLTGIFLTVKKAGHRIFPLYWDNKKYLLLLKESLPQYGVTLFNIVLARFDWVLLGILTTGIITAEYSFAYKAFELSRLPLLVISPLLLPIFSRIFRDNKLVSSSQNAKLRLLFHTEMALSALLPVLLASCWSPLMDSLTDQKYGTVNEATFLILSFCVPIQFATDYYWNLCFAQDHMRQNLKVSVYSCILNIALNIVLIPMYGGVGAACAYLACFLVQLILYNYYTRHNTTKPDLIALVKAIGSAMIAILVTRYLISTPVMAAIIALVIYLLLSILTRLVVIQKIRPVLRLLLKR
jgi:O-antigen/teichoic acid export membrane protein